MAQQAPAFKVLAKYPEALVALSHDANMAAQYGKNPQAFADAVNKNPAYANLAANARDVAAISNAQVFNAIAQKQNAVCFCGVVPLRSLPGSRRACLRENLQRPDNAPLILLIDLVCA